MQTTTQNKNAYFDRELIWLEFNRRVLEEAQNKDNPLLERLKFLTIFASNLDEFFMVRIAGLLQLDREKVFYQDRSVFESIYDVLIRINQKVSEMIDEQQKCFQEICDELTNYDVVIKDPKELSPQQMENLDKYFEESILPVLTPLSFDPAHPFPFLTNLGLYLVVIPEEETTVKKPTANACFLEIPAILPRLIPLEDEDGHKYILIEDIIEQNLDKVFFDLKVKEVGLIRVTRNLDYSLFENEVVDLMKSMKKELITREQQDIVRLEVESRLSDEIIKVIRSQNEILDESIFRVDRPLHLNRFSDLYDLPFPKLKYEPFNPRLPKVFSSDEDIYSIIKKKEVLVHHPFETFNVVVEFIKAAANDPNVLAIKQTLYRSGGSSPVIKALKEAAENGKHVTAVVELKARFDEKNNMIWAKELQKVGVNVVFGFVEYKTHAKACLVVRREKDGLRRYVHLATGNYNHQSAKFYTDIGFFTSDPKIGQDVAYMFNMVTGVNFLKSGSRKSLAKGLKSSALAPLNIRSRLIKDIDAEIENAKKGEKAEIFGKMNQLVDYELIDKLYEASNAGVKIRLIVRGICCLIPGVENLSANIKVKSIVGRFLEHSRIYSFHAGGKTKVYLSSADWMPRNFDRRIEIMWPVNDQKLKSRLVTQILEVTWSDTHGARDLTPDGTYIKPQIPEGQEPFSSQKHFMTEARNKGIKLSPYVEPPRIIRDLARIKK